ncbi:MAG: dihydroneopterin aldolase [Aureispira sp.]|nr:dihydroneopterin aldolase [Aureispira sp.]
MGLIAIEGMHFYAYHGFYQEEQLIGGNYIVDVLIETDFDDAAYEDNLDHTVNYETIYRITKVEMQKNSKLIESIGQRIIDRIKSIFDTVEGITVKITKKNPPLGARVDQAYIELSESYVVECNKCGRAFLSHAPGDCWTRHGQVYPETKSTLMRTHGRNICRNCLSPYFIKARELD